jgi:hypothetical protein
MGAVWLGCLLGIQLLHRRGRLARLALVALGLGGAAACWAFVPTTGGISLVEAHRLLGEAQNLPVGDVARFQAGASTRQKLRVEFPRFIPDLAAAERTWIQKTVAERLHQAELDLKKDPQAASQRLQQLAADLRQSEDYATVASQVLRARQRAVRARLKLGTDEMLEAMNTGRYAAVAAIGKRLLSDLNPEADEVNLGREVHRQVRIGRERALRGQLDAGVALLETLCRRGEYAVVPAAARRLVVDLAGEAFELQLLSEVVNRLVTVRRKALSARLEAVRGELEARFKRAEHEKVAALAEQARREMHGEAREVGKPNLVSETLGPVRRKAAVARIEAASRKLEVLLKAGKYSEVGEEGRQAVTNLASEAGATGVADLLQTKLRLVRQLAVLARLDELRKEVRALLVKDQFAKVAEVGQRAAAELGQEAGAVGVAADLARFKEGCEVFGDLARKAKKSDPD